MSQYITKFIASSAVVAMGCLIMSCTKGPFDELSIESGAMIDGSLYLLLGREVGLNKAAQFSDNNALQTTGISLALARYNFNTEGSGKLEIIGYGQFDPKLYDIGLFSVYGTNKILAPCRSGDYQIFQLSQTGKPMLKKSFVAKDVIFSGNQNYMLAVSNPVRLLSGVTIDETNDPSMPIFACKQALSSKSLKRLAVACDPRVFAIESGDVSLSSISIVDSRGSGRTNSISTGSSNYIDLMAISTNYMQPCILVSIYMPKSQRSAENTYYAILGSDGHEVARYDTFHTMVVPDGDFSRVIFLNNISKANKFLSIDVWFPFAGRSSSLSLPLSEIQNNLNSNPARQPQYP